MNRRTLLHGAVVGSIVPAASVGTESVGDEAASASGRADESTGKSRDDTNSVSVRIVDAPETVAGGALLEWTVEVENRTSEPVRPTVEYVIDGESAGSVTLTVEPGATERPFPQSYRTEPVARDEEITLRVETDGDADERTVALLGVDELDDGRRFPADDPSVRPGTAVHFEVGDDPDASQTTSWWIDGERVGDTLASPRQAIYHAERGAHYWQEAFDAVGTPVVVAGVEIDGERYRASWTVTVAEDGLAGPTIDGARPEPGRLEIDPDEPTDLAIDVADPNGRLERVVWWLTQADAVLGVSDVSGATDTATLTVEEGLCRTCRVVPWVITSDGTVATESVWEVGAPGNDCPSSGFDLTIASTNDPVDAGDVLEVTVECENTGAEPVERPVDLIVGHDPTLVDSRSVTVPGGATETIVLAFETATVANDQSFPVRVETDGSADERTVQVRGTENE